MHFKGFIAALAALVALLSVVFPARAEPLKIVGLGDSLMAAYGLEKDLGFPARLEAALRERGYEVEIADAGVSGDTTAGGLARLDWSVPDGTDAVILELGANDALRGISPENTRSNLEEIVRRLRDRRIPVLLAGMLAPPNMGERYEKAFNAIYPDLAAGYDLPLYPFFLEGVAANPDLLQPDGMHPNIAGIEVIVANFAPVAAEFIDGIVAARPEGN